MTLDAQLTEEVRRMARDLGFARVGVARAQRLESEGKRLRDWIDAGYHAGMEWMASHSDVRTDPTHPGMLEGARSVVVVALAYAVGPPTKVGLTPGRVAAYARGRDYHTIMRKRLRAIAKHLRVRGHAARACVDTAPVLERSWAQRAGLGFVGKNCCLIVPGLGSHVFLGTVITDAVLEADDPMPSKCGSCRRCLDGCPTRAFVAPGVLDANRCLAYWTIEHRGTIPREFADAVGDRLFGCDDCQDVCPFNAGRPTHRPDPAFDTIEPCASLGASDLLTMSASDFDRTFVGSPLKRCGWEGAARNGALVLGNAGERHHLPVLQHAAAEHPCESVRDAAQWAATRVDERAPAG